MFIFKFMVTECLGHTRAFFPAVVVKTRNSARIRWRAESNSSAGATIFPPQVIEPHTALKACNDYPGLAEIPAPVGSQDIICV